jgi:hypothetical protein
MSSENILLIKCDADYCPNYVSAQEVAFVFALQKNQPLKMDALCRECQEQWAHAGLYVEEMLRRRETA